MPDENPPAPESQPPEQHTLLGNMAPDEMVARAMQTVRMTNGAGGTWQPPTLEQTASLFPGYTVLTLLGRGGMGAVYQAREIELDRLVAIKLLPLEVSVDKDFADRFRREARAMARLNHPNIITVHAFGTTREGHLYFVMEFVDGANLADIIHASPVAGATEPAASGSLAPDQALSIVEQVCTALEFAHGEGIVHRDIKPANVMVDRRGRVKVADFGLARLTDPSAEKLGHTMTGTVMGTPDYMAPEQMEAMNVDHRADIYSLGVMLYEMLCRQVPKGIFQPPSYRTGCDTRIDAIVIKAMQQAPEHRYQSTAEMKTDIAAARASSAPPVSASVPAPPPPPRKPGVPKAPPRPARSAPPETAVMKAIVPTEPAKKSKVPLLAGVAVILLAAIGALEWMKHSGEMRSRASQSSIATPEPGAIKIWNRADEFTPTPERTWENGVVRLTSTAVLPAPVMRDVVLRASVRANPDAKDTGLTIRRTGRRTAENTHYGLTLNVSKGVLIFHVFNGVEKRSLHSWPLPRTYRADEWVRLELRAVGDAFTPSLDGHPLDTVHDSTLNEPGELTVHALANGYFREIEYVPLDRAPAAAGTSATNSPSDAWQPLFTKPEWEQVGHRLEFVDGMVHISDYVQKTKILSSPDGAIRARVIFREGSYNPSVVARSTKEEGSYKLMVVGDGTLLLNYNPAGSKETEALGNYRLPRKLATGDEFTLELRLHGDKLTGLFIGIVVIEARDGRLNAAGEWGIYAKNGWFQSVEIQPLSTPPHA
jgi:serine/threonine protein kinase